MELGWSVLPHPPYWPDLAPTYYHLFRSVQNSLTGNNFSDDNQVREFVENLFASKPTEFYVKGIEDLPNKWIANNGECVID